MGAYSCLPTACDWWEAWVWSEVVDVLVWVIGGGIVICYHGSEHAWMGSVISSVCLAGDAC